MLEELKKELPYKDLDIHYHLFIIRIYVNDYVIVKNSKVLQALSFVLQNLITLDQLTLLELIGNMNYHKREEIKNHPKQKDVMEYLKSEYLVNVLKKIDNDEFKSE